MKIFKSLFFFLSLAITVSFFSCGDEPVEEPDTTSTLYEESTVSYTCTDATKDYTIVNVTDRGLGTGNVTWTKNKTYVLNGRVFVNEGQTLTIEAGTIVKGAAGTGEKAAALIVARGGKIVANGTATEPIIFTSIVDDIARDKTGALTCAGGNLATNFRGLWGGIIILGKAKLNSTEKELAIEGIPTTEKRGLYGGTDDTDNSGTLKYVSIRYGGALIGADNEINGLTLGAVGNGTTIDYVEVIANKDDGVEFFGGTVNTKHLVITNCGDDSFDTDEGYNGKNQFWVTFQDEEGDNGGEHDGGPADCLLCQPYSNFQVYNATFVGNTKTRAIRVRENSAASYYNSIFVNYDKGFEINGAESLAQYNNGLLKFNNNVLFNIVKPWDANSASVSTQLLAAGNTTDVDPKLSNKSVPGANLGTLYTSSDSYFTNVNYKGAFDPSASTRWIDGWTLTSTIR